MNNKKTADGERPRKGVLSVWDVDRQGNIADIYSPKYPNRHLQTPSLHIKGIRHYYFDDKCFAVLAQRWITDIFTCLTWWLSDIILTVTSKSVKKKSVFLTALFFFMYWNCRTEAGTPAGTKTLRTLPDRAACVCLRWRPRKPPGGATGQLCTRNDASSASFFFYTLWLRV